MEGVRQAAEEIAATEERLVADLEVLKDVFAGPLKKWGAQLESGLAVVDHLEGAEVSGAASRLFGPLDDVVAFAREFAPALRDAERTGAWRACFERRETALVECYGRYVARYTAAWEELAALRARSQAVESFLRCCELQPANARNLTLASLAIMPVQRAPRYVLLLGELRKRLAKQAGARCGPAGDDGDALAAAEACARRAAAAVNETIACEDSRRGAVARVAACYQRCEQTAEWLESASEKKVVLDGAMSRVTRSGPVESYFALFEDRLVYGDEAHALDLMKSRVGRRGSNAAAAAAPEDGGRYALHRELRLEECFICRAAGDGKGGYGDAKGLAPWEFLVLSAEKSFVVSAKDAAEARTWVDATRLAGAKRAARAGKASRAPPRAAAAYVKRGASTALTDFDVFTERPPASARHGSLYVQGGDPEDAAARADAPSLVARPRGAATPIGTGVSMPFFSGGAGSPRADRDRRPSVIQHSTHDVAREEPPRAERSSSAPTPPRPAVDLLDAPPPEPTPPAARVAPDGFFVVTVPVDLSKGLGLELQNVPGGGVRVAALAPDSVCAETGVRVGDAVLRVGDAPVASTADVVDALRARRDRPVVAISLRRAARPARAATLEANPFHEPAPAAAAAAAAPNPFLAPDPPPPPPPNPFSAAPRSPPNPFSAAPHSPPTPPPAAPEVDLEEVVRGAVAVGFNEADAVRAVSAGHTDVDSVVNWILDNPV